MSQESPPKEPPQSPSSSTPSNKNKSNANGPPAHPLPPYYNFGMPSPFLMDMSPRHPQHPANMMGSPQHTGQQQTPHYYMGGPHPPPHMMMPMSSPYRMPSTSRRGGKTPSSSPVKEQRHPPSNNSSTPYGSTAAYAAAAAAAASHGKIKAASPATAAAPSSSPYKQTDSKNNNGVHPLPHMFAMGAHFMDPYGYHHPAYAWSPHHQHHQFQGSPTTPPPTINNSKSNTYPNSSTKDNSNKTQQIQKELKFDLPESVPPSKPKVSAPAPSPLAVCYLNTTASKPKKFSSVSSSPTSISCTCKKTRCLKLYCQCFAVKSLCGESCRCVSCHNQTAHEADRLDAMRVILARNPSAFDNKYYPAIKTAQDRPASSPPRNSRSQIVSMAEAAEGQPPLLPAAPAASSPTRSHVPAPQRPKALAHKNGCKCRKSGCMKKYCECYAGGVKCGDACRCMGCKNMGPIMFDGNADQDAAAQVVAEVAQAAHAGAMPMPHHPSASPAPYYLPPHMPPGDIRYGMVPPVAYHPHYQHPYYTVDNNSTSLPLPLPPKPAASLPPTPAPSAIAKPKSDCDTPEEPWLAAQNLTFLKQGTPSPDVAKHSEASESKRQFVYGNQSPRDKELYKVPSLTASSSGEGTPQRVDDPESRGVNSLLLAAMAMTGDFGPIKSIGGGAPLSSLSKRQFRQDSPLQDYTKRPRVETPSKQNGHSSPFNAPPADATYYTSV